MQRLNPVILATIIIIFAIALTPISSLADCRVTLQWDAVNDTSIAGYCIYLRVEGGSYDYDWPEWQGTSTQHEVPDLDEDTVYYFVVRAYDENGNESVDSNEVQFIYNGSSNAPGSPTNTSNDGGGESSSGGCFIDSMSMMLMR